jgi:hypothetical protein
MSRLKFEPYYKFTKEVFSGFLKIVKRLNLNKKLREIDVSKWPVNN